MNKVQNTVIVAVKFFLLLQILKAVFLCRPPLGPDSMLNDGDNSCTQSRPQISVAQITIVACRMSSEISVLFSGFCLKGMVMDSDELLSTIALSLICCSSWRSASFSKPFLTKTCRPDSYSTDACTCLTADRTHCHKL